MRFFRRHTFLPLLALLTPALAIAPQAEPEDVLKCAARPRPNDICLAPTLGANARHLLAGAANARALPFRAPLWSAQEREYKLVAPGVTLYVTLARGGTGPWQVRQASAHAAPRVFVPGGQLSGNAPVTVHASGFPAGARIAVRVTAPSPWASALLVEGPANADGTAALSFVMPSVWRTPAQDRLITERELVLVGAADDGRVKAATPPLPYRPLVAERDLSATFEGEALRFKYLRGQKVREHIGWVDVLELNTLDAVTVMQARRFERNPQGPDDERAYVRELLTWQPEALRPFGSGELKVEGEVDTPGGRAWRLLVQGDAESRPVFVLFRGAFVWVVQGNPEHAPLLDAMVSTLEVR